MLLGFHRFFLFAFVLLFSASVFAERKIPELSGPVMDEAGFLSPGERQSLYQLLRSFFPKIQLQIWTIESLDDEPIENLSIRAVDKWKLGTKKEDKGILILVSKKERRMRIEVGQGLEGDIPDALAGRIVDQIMKPAFKAGAYATGFENAAQFIYQKATGGPAPELQETPQPSEPKINFIFVLIFFGIIGLINFLSRRRGYYGGGGFYGGGFGGGSSGGGGWSGGGGGFSGGGASGDW
ncbi:MAG: hypothetical protein JWQ35_1160 [Bacteriovoracaceae bacterium]|nr:hypothetical protein [Bacteriovoracaceae bacterium]